MLQSTYRRPLPEQPSLPAPWTQHKAPSGHTYYYNPETKQSTYTHPGTAATQNAPSTSQQPFSQPLRYAPDAFSDFSAHATGQFRGNSSSRGNFHHGRHNRFRQPQDRPKSKLSIPGCSPWVLVKTRLGRRFVHNPTTNESYWKIPEHLEEGIKGLDADKSADLPASEKVDDDTPAHDDEKQSNEGGNSDANLVDQRVEESDEYEEVEVTDEEFKNEEDEEEDDETNPAKRVRLSEEAQEPDAPAEFGEDDMAYQLAQMEGEYGDDEDYYDDEWQQGDGDDEMTTEEAESSFRGLLDDYKIDPFTTWDTVISDGAIIDDERYTLLPNMKARRDVFASWSTAKIQARKQEKETQSKRNPLIPYLALLEKHATPKLFWAEFKRKYKREPELKDGKLSDREREKLYREHINRLTKMSEEARKKDLRTLLESILPSASWNRSTTPDDLLPSALLTDVRYISLPSATKNSVVLEFLKTLPTQEQIEPEDGQATKAKSDAEQARLQRALERREREVKYAKRQQEKELHYGKRQLHDENARLDRAMKVDKAALGRALED